MGRNKRDVPNNRGEENRKTNLHVNCEDSLAAAQHVLFSERTVQGR
jgi:hypothetical protein